MSASGGNGIGRASDWVPGAPFGAASDHFTSGCEATYPKTPRNWAAGSYDTVWFIARGLKQACSAEPTKLQAALVSVGNTGFAGVLGQIKAVNGEKQSKPLLVQWLDGKAVPPANQNP